ncbi:MAG: OmpA family protein [Pseudomonadota bacterium]
MNRKRIFMSLAAFGLAAMGAGATAYHGAGYVERSSREAVDRALRAELLDWASVETDGLLIVLTGTAPSETARFRAITRAGRVVDPNRVVDGMEVVAADPVAPPQFSLEILRNDANISVIGLVPGQIGRTGLETLLADVEAGDITNMVETADYSVPAGWPEAVQFAMEALETLPRSKVTVAPGRVSITAVADSDAERRRLESELSRARPRSVSLEVDIAAPRPVIAPFTLRFVMPPDAPPRFDACAVDSEVARIRILAAAADAGFEGKADCVTALGVPSASWGEAAALSISALAEFGGGSVTLSDADVTLVAQDGTDRDLFDRVAAELETALPDIFSVSAVLPEPTVVDGTGEAETGPPEFVATLSPEGQVQLRGRLFDQTQERAVLSYGRALFGVDDTYIATRADDTLPEGWPGRVFTGLDALTILASGSVVVQPDFLVIRGETGNQRADLEISGLLSDRLGSEADFRIDVIYREELDPLLNIPTPAECEESLNGILLEEKLSFAPGEAVIELSGEGQLLRLAEELDRCKRSAFEIGGHTDSQGREVMNLQLSQDRAEAVRAALITRGVPPDQLAARGYGEAEPIAENDTEAGREANRRITFTILGAEANEGEEAASEDAAVEATADPGEAPSDGAATEDDTAESAVPEAPSDEAEEATGESIPTDAPGTEDPEEQAEAEAAGTEASGDTTEPSEIVVITGRSNRSQEDGSDGAPVEAAAEATTEPETAPERETSPETATAPPTPVEDDPETEDPVAEEDPNRPTPPPARPDPPEGN